MRPRAYLLIVRRGCDGKLAFLRESFARHANVRVLADRRSDDRRRARRSVALERRRGERRREPPRSWTLADYVLVPLEQPDAARLNGTCRATALARGPRPREEGSKA